ncbi:MAG: hypothetical protein ACD_75C01361G0003 [uncultured bacterium]|nr:MAG: hypothetical protein ACD_75C01361G0003 [uncultured bacterium]
MMPTIVVRNIECFRVKRKISPSLPTRFVAEVATAMDWGEIILPQTPPEVLAATRTTGSTPICCPVTTCSLEKKAFDEVSEPVIKTPSQPRNGAKNGKNGPVEAKAFPRVTTIPEKLKI